MGMIDARKIPPTPGQLAALEEAKKTGSLGNPAGFQAMIEALQARHSGTKDNSAVREIVELTFEQRVAWQMAELTKKVAELAKQVAALGEEVAALRAQHGAQ